MPKPIADKPEGKKSKAKERSVKTLTQTSLYRDA